MQRVVGLLITSRPVSWVATWLNEKLDMLIPPTVNATTAGHVWRHLLFELPASIEWAHGQWTEPSEETDWEQDGAFSLKHQLSVLACTDPLLDCSSLESLRTLVTQLLE